MARKTTKQCNGCKDITRLYWITYSTMGWAMAAYESVAETIASYPTCPEKGCTQR